ncbi:MAG TPA: tryptophan synthase subunit alpha [Spirochaetota bacterium]|nr:tryptophan synthase subunit alpha [Spirochaetota bacterium]HOL56413.1 tryptophan synthase subunit alpha [Spirochaetota bacterium]HPP03897.1 tryptophan synthase subunit alpha [Spirochaetota bacterium]
MNRIDEKLSLLNNKKIGFMGHIVACFPDYDKSLIAANAICKGGADFIEVQFPFSDPTADGPTIEEACYIAIENGFTVNKGFDLTEKIIKNNDTAVLIMTYANIIFKYGIDRFLNKARDIGVSGVIVPDLLPEQDEGLNTLCKKNGIHNILIATPGDIPERIKELSYIGSGFLYTVMRRGITGKKTDITEETENWLKMVKSNSNLPVAAGFGIQSRSQIESLIGKADIAVVGSYFVKKIKEFSLDFHTFEENIYNCMKELL